MEIPWDKPAVLTLTDGSAEIFGSEMRPGRKYTLRGQKIAVFTYEGAVIEAEGAGAEGAYIGDETPMSYYLNVHWLLEQVRKTVKNSPNLSKFCRRNSHRLFFWDHLFI